MREHRDSAPATAGAQSPFTGSDVPASGGGVTASGYTDQHPSTRAASQPMTQQLLMIEDDTRLATMVGEYLRQSGYGFTHAVDGGSGLEALQACQPDLVILDLMLPDMDGLEVCRRIKGLGGDTARTAVLMLTAKGDPMDRIVGLEIGADDYLPKPFEPRELLARIRAVLRRGADAGNAASSQKAMRFGSLEIDRDARAVSVSGKACELTSYQFDLLVALAERAGRVLSRDQIMEAVRGRELEAFDRSIDVHMGRIRSAIEVDAKDPKRILTVRGVGYVFAKQQS
jgi:DNA-binding response OmpR family regulator